MLWSQLERALAKAGVPKGEAMFRARLRDGFTQITGQPLETAPDMISVPALLRANGGMSNGMVSARAWRDYLIPLLITRHRQLARLDEGSTTPPAVTPDADLIQSAAD